MAFWEGWPTDRILMVFSGLAFVMISIQVGLFHYRGNFRHWVMWGPVLSSPLLALLALALGVWNVYWLRVAFAVLLAVELVAATIGFILHVRGIMLRVGGWKLRNVLTGPPVMMPLMLAAISLLGFIAIYWPGLATALAGE
ncbi:MAG: hypothetical protein M0Z31_09755 [Clostridia bacterium]|nr:hypothetical protein [Clostridia bacterium]